MRDRILDWVERHFLKSVALAILTLVLALCMITYNVSHARDVPFEWDLATQRIDGTPLLATEIAATRVEWGTCVSGQFGTQVGVRDIAPPPVTTTIALAKGFHCLRAYTVDTDGLVSDPTTVLQVQVKERPKPPGGPRVK